MNSLKAGITAVAAACTLAAASLAFADHDDDGVEYPEAFRSFTHVTTGIVTPGFTMNVNGEDVDLGAQVPGLHNIYANRRAMIGYRQLAAARPTRFPEGAVIAFDLWEPGVLNSGTGSFTFQKQRLAVAVMEKNRQKYYATGGWGFQVFDPVTQKPLLKPADQEACFACHEALTEKGADFVFSRFSN